MDTEDYAYRDALPRGPAHRRGAGLNPGNRFEDVRLHILGEELDRQWIECENVDGSPHRVERTVYLDRTKHILNRVAPTSDVPFDWTLNPYRGCEHGCVYCFARPYHEYLGFSCGLDFETKILAKPDAPDLLRRELASPKWKPEPIVMSAITDIYQPIEHRMRISRRCLEVLAECGQPVSTMTKSALVLRDTDLWSRLAGMNAGRVIVTLVTLDADLAKALEPRATLPAGRLRIIRELTAAGVPVSVNVAPVIPGLTDVEVPRILEAVAEAGARRAAWVLLRLPYQLKDLFLDWLKRCVHPDRARKVESLIRQSRGGKLYEAAVNRGRGRGPIVEQIAQTFDVFTRKYGLNRNIRPLSTAHFRRPEAQGQGRLFG
ncbi:MAG: PA0069 family radical SAM protein [Phycisphaeraceae bacterium]|nr:PA0069 family radical SAM protein [Phycisphaerales bacterium]QOJ17509.1 MAG: PA0069 family radical SAM protein [Phycisphaeraceae bacterium]